MGAAKLEKIYRWVGLAILTCLLLTVAGVLTGRAAHQANGLPALWPCDAIVLGMLVARNRGRAEQVAIVIGALLGGIAFNLAGGLPILTATILSLGSIGAAVIARTLLARLGASSDIFGRVSDVFTLVVGCAGGSLLSATIGATGFHAHHGIPFIDAWLSRYGAAFLGDLMLVPMMVIGTQLTDRQHTRAIAGRTLAEVAILLGAIALLSEAVFCWTRLPLLFLITPVVLLVTFRLRALGAAGAVAIVFVISAYATAHGHGPINAHVASTASQALLLQLFLASCFITALPVAALLNEREVRVDEMRRLADQLQTVIENIGEVIYRIDADGKWVYLNPAWETLTGHSIAATMGQPWAALVDEDDRAELVERLAPVLSGRERTLRRTVRFLTAAGPRWMELFIQTLTAADGTPAGATGTLRDIDDRKRLEEHVMTAKRRAEQRAREATLLASTDELTGLANRRAFMQQLERELTGAAEFGWPLAVAMFDVDHFKSVNDRYGHAVGDRVLQLIARRAGTAVRSGDVIGRLGGEEFGILMPGASAEDAMVVAERLRVAMETMRDEDKTLPAVTVSIGIAEREDMRDPLALLAGADAALYSAKEAGRNRVRLAA